MSHMVNAIACHGLTALPCVVLHTLVESGVLLAVDPEAPTGDEILSEDEAFDALESQPQPQSSQPGLLRPGVVHRLDKGTTGAHSAASQLSASVSSCKLIKPCRWKACC